MYTIKYMPDSTQMTEEQQKQLEEKIKNMSPEELQEFQKQQCIFCQILTGKIPSKKVYEDDICQAILDVNPAAKGHLLLVPKEHYAIMPQVPDKVIGHLFTISKKLSQVMLKALKVSGTNVFIANGPAAGQRSQHFLLHIIPRVEGDGILELSEKLIEKEMQQKVKTAVKDKLLALLGKKPAAKKVVEPEVLPPLPEEKPKEKSKEPEEEKKEEEADLDDIANLFK